MVASGTVAAEVGEDPKSPLVAEVPVEGAADEVVPNSPNPSAEVVAVLVVAGTVDTPPNRFAVGVLLNKAVGAVPAGFEPKLNLRAVVAVVSAAVGPKLKGAVA